MQVSDLLSDDAVAQLVTPPPPHTHARFHELIYVLRTAVVYLLAR